MAGARPLWLLSGVLLWTSAAVAQVTFVGSQINLVSGTWSSPVGMSTDGKGNIFIADLGNNRVVELSPAGTGFKEPVTILSGLSAPMGVAANWAGDVYVSDTGNGRILMLPITKEGFGAAVTVSSGLDAPAGIAVDSANNLYVAEPSNNSVVMLPLVAGSYGAPIVVGTGLSRPLGVAVDAARNIFIADTGNTRIVKEPFAAGAYGTQQLVLHNTFTPGAISVDKSENLYIADIANQRVFELPWMKVLGYFAPPVTLGSGFLSPAGVVTDFSGNVYAADSQTNQVTKIVAGSIAFGNVGVGSSGSILTYNFNILAGTQIGAVSIFMQGVTGKDFQDAGGSSCVAQTYTVKVVCGVNVEFAPQASGARLGAVELFDPSGTSLAIAFISGVGAESRAAYIPGTESVIGTGLSGPSGVAIDGNGDVFIADTGNNRVVELPWTGGGYGNQTVVPVRALSSPMGVAVDGAGNLYVVSNGNDKVVKLPWTQDGYGPQETVGIGLYGPTGVTVDTSGNVYITNTLENRVIKAPWTGDGYGKQGKLGNYHKVPIGIAVDGTGNAFFSDPYENTISEVAWSGSSYLLEVPMRQVHTTFPTALATDGNGNLYILDTDRNQLLMLPWTGSGFGSQITVASGFNAPSGLAIDGNGVLYVADSGNNQIVRIDLSTPGPLSFTDTYIGSTSGDSARHTLVGNTGNQPLTLSAIDYPADFPEDPGATNACEDDSSLAQSEWCELAIDFTPLTVGSPLNEAIGITDNSLGAAGAQQSVSLTGVALSKSTQAISFPSIPAQVYGAAPIALAATSTSGLPVTFAVVSGPGVLTQRGRMLSLKGVGTIVLQAAQIGNSGYGAAPPVEVSVPVTPAMLTVTPLNATAVYGAIPSTFRYAITGFVNGESAEVAVKGAPAIASAASIKSGAGSYALTAAQGTLSAANYIFTFTAGTLTVNKAVIQVQALSLSHAYGAPMPKLAWKLTGFVNGDQADVMSGVPEVTTAANSGSPVGTYKILASVGTLAAANYNFVSVGSELTVVPAVLTVAAKSQTVTYGSPIPALSYSIGGFVNGDTASNVVRGAPGIATTAGARPPAGTYPIALSVGTLSAGNYTFKVLAGALSITKATVAVIPGNISLTYGESLPKLPYSVTGLVYGETTATAMSGAPALLTPANARSIPGSYAIVAGPGTLASKNYTFTFGAAVATVTKAKLTVTPKSLSMTYGSRPPALAYTYCGFLNGDGPQTVSGEPILTSQANSSSPVGVYQIAGSVGTLSSARYTFQMAGGAVTVTKAVLTVSAVSQSTTYGAGVPALGYAVSGLLNGDKQATALTGTPRVSSPATAHSPVGQYAIQISPGTLAAMNYSFQFASGQLTVTKALLKVAANNLSVTVGSTVPGLTYAASGLVNGDTLTSATSGAPALSTSATTSKAGSYPIKTGPGSLSASNYELTFANGTLTVMP